MSRSDVHFGSPCAITSDESRFMAAMGQLIGGVPVAADSIATLPLSTGAYAILLRLDEKVVFSRRSGFDSFEPGWYVYAGSAYGPGGLRARIARHLKRSKTLRWHIDHLTSVAATAQAIAIKGGNECAIVGTLIGSGLFVCTANGFGASDCTTCQSHLLRPAAG